MLIKYGKELSKVRSISNKQILVLKFLEFIFGFYKHVVKIFLQVDTKKCHLYSWTFSMMLPDLCYPDPDIYNAMLRERSSII